MKTNSLLLRAFGAVLLLFAISCSDDGLAPKSSMIDPSGEFLTDDFRQNPVINTVVPGTWPVGETITINGSFFSNVIAYNTVTFGGVSAVITEATAGRLVVTVPANAGSGVKVTSDGFTSNTKPFTVIQPNTWQYRNVFPVNVVRKAGVAFSINGKGYVGTGVHPGGQNQKDFWEYDPKTNQWTQKADYAGGERQGPSGFSIGSKGYIGTGYPSGSGGPTRDFYEYNPATNVWARKADFPGTGRAHGIGFSIGNKGYIGTGTGGGSATNVFKDFWEYNQDNNVWTRKADFAGDARYQAIGLAIGVKGYIGAGAQFRRDFWEYSPLSNSWTRKTDIPGSTPTTGFGCNSKGYVGMNTSDGKLWEFNPATNAWALKADYPEGPLFLGMSFAIGNWGYFVGGDDPDSSSPYGNYLYRYVVN